MCNYVVKKKNPTMFQQPFFPLLKLKKNTVPPHPAWLCFKFDQQVVLLAHERLKLAKEKDESQYSCHTATEFKQWFKDTSPLLQNTIGHSGIKISLCHLRVMKHVLSGQFHRTNKQVFINVAENNPH